MIPQADRFQPHEIAKTLGYPVELVRNLQHGPFLFHPHFVSYELVLNQKGPWGDVLIVPWRMHDAITGETWTKMPEPEYAVDHAKVQKIFDDMHVDMDRIAQKIKPALGRVYPEHDPNNETVTLQLMPNGNWIVPITSSGLDWAHKRRPLPELNFKVDHDWVMHVDVSHIDPEHHQTIHAAIKEHLPERHVFRTK